MRPRRGQLFEFIYQTYDYERLMHKHSEVPQTASTAYTIQAGGTVDGERMRDPVDMDITNSMENNVALLTENVCHEVVVNPRISVNGMAAERRKKLSASQWTTGCPKSEKGTRSLEFARRHRYHSTTADDEVKDTVKMLNIYDNTMPDEAYTVSNRRQVRRSVGGAAFPTAVQPKSFTTERTIY